MRFSLWKREKPKPFFFLSSPIFSASAGSLQQRRSFLGEIRTGLIDQPRLLGQSEMDHDETGCQSPPEGPKLCINNCGFFGSSATMNMCSKCHKAILFQQEQGARFASAVSGCTSSSSNILKETFAATALVDAETKSVEPVAVFVQPSSVQVVVAEVVAPEAAASIPKEGPSRCATCNKRVGLTGFKCRCGDLFCGTHRYADIHNCSFNYHAAAQEAIAKANPVVKAEKLDKI
ncbi:hypothetical protein BRARA_H00211 [Brassica rapa]|uniref:Uncharacterized protein n=1 Tax=Brassica campestris TaxID=3711 RepID=A0A397YEH1_BRACM|nr:hypothetical protein BRARA_H00211 [Brassica rapa]